MIKASTEAEDLWESGLASEGAEPPKKCIGFKCFYIDSPWLEHGILDSDVNICDNYNWRPVTLIKDVMAVCAYIL